LDAFKILEALSKKHEVTLLSFVSREDRANVGALKELCSEVVTIPVPASPGSWKYLAYTGLSYISQFPAIARMCHSRQMICEVQRHIARGVDAVHVEFTQMAHYTRYFGGTPCVLDESDLAYIRRERFAETLKPGCKRALLSVDNRKQKRYELTWASQFDAVLVRTECDRQTLQAELGYGKKIVTVPPWVDIAVRHNVSAVAEETSLLFYGAMWRPVNSQAAHYFIDEILPIVRASYPDARFIVAGSRPPASLTHLSSKAIEITGFIQDVSPFYSRCPIVVAPLLAGAGIKGKIIQGLSCGRPVVTTSVGAEGIPATEADGLFVRNDPKSFASCICWLLDQNHYLEFREGAQSFVRKSYHWQSGMERVESVYQDITIRTMSAEVASQG